MPAEQRSPLHLATACMIGGLALTLSACGPKDAAPAPAASVAPAAAPAPAAPVKPVQHGAMAGGVVQFGAGLDGVPYLTKGWSAPEGWGVWSEGPTAQLTLPIDKLASDKPLTLNFQVSGFVTDKSPQQTVAVKAGGRDLATWSWTFDGKDHKAGVQHVAVPADLLAGKTALVIEFAISKPTSPKSVGMNADARALGLQLVDVGFEQ